MDGIIQEEKLKGLYTENYKMLIKEMQKTQIQIYPLFKSKTVLGLFISPNGIRPKLP